MHPMMEMRVFSEVVKAGSFVDAGHVLGLSPSAVSKKIARFEKRLEARLFNRTTRSLSLTEAGQLLFERSENILSAIENTEDAIRNFHALPTGVLRVAASDALSVEVLVPFLKGFADIYPDISVLLVQGDGGIDLLKEGVDVALLFERPTETSFIARKLIDDPWVVCASPKYLESFGHPESPADLKNHRCLAIHAKGKTNDRWEFQNGQSVKIDSCLSGIGLTIKTATLQAMGIARLARFLVHSELQQGTLTPIFAEELKDENRAIFAVYPNREYLPKKTRVFVDSFESYIKRTIAP
ncbi:MAG: LysR family transcriptional regulator [Parasphingorhabdus sp.]